MTSTGAKSSSPTNSTNNDCITLQPTNWVFNAAVIGFLKIVEREGIEKNVEAWFKNNGTVEVPKCKFKDVSEKTELLHFNGEYKKLKIIGKNKYHPNYWQGDWSKDSFKDFIKSLVDSNIITDKPCAFCNKGYYIDNNTLNSLKEDVKKFLNLRKEFSLEILNLELGPARKDFPNSFWNYRSSVPICHLCVYLLLYTPVGLTSLNDGKHEIFINAPSFKVMWHLNRYAETTISKTDNYDLKRLLGLMLIEFARDTMLTLHRWLLYEIEIISIIKEKNYEKKKNKNKKEMTVEFFQLPTHIAQILSNDKVATLLSDLNEQSILNKIINGEFEWLLETGQILLSSALKGGSDKTAEEVLKKRLPRLSGRSDEYPQLGQKILQLYAKIYEELAKDYSLKAQ